MIKVTNGEAGISGEPKNDPSRAKVTFSWQAKQRARKTSEGANLELLLFWVRKNNAIQFFGKCNK